MTPDEHEARLRDAVIKTVEHYYEATIAAILRRSLDPPNTGGNGEGWDLGVLGTARDAALDAYAEWLRLRAVAEQPCYIVWPDAVTALKRALTLTAKGKIFRKSGGRVTCLEQAASAPDEEIPLCPPCKAQQQIAAILAAAENADSGGVAAP